MTAESVWQRKLKMAASTDVVDVFAQDGDTDDRYTIDAAGKQEWGGGTSAVDVVLERTGAGVIDLSTGALAVNGLKIAEADVAATKKYLTKALTAATHGTGSEVDTGLNLPASAIVTDVFLVVTTAEVTGSTKTLDIGTMTTSNDPDGFADALSVAATGIKRPQVTVTTGCNETYFSANTRGVLLSQFVAGSDTATDVGTYHEIPDVTSSADDISVTSGSAFTEFAGTLVIEYIELA